MSRSVARWPPVDTEPPERHPNAPAAGTELGPHYAQCFGCGNSIPNGLRLHSTAGSGLTVHTRFLVAEGHQGAPGLVHGGLLATAFDEALGLLNALIRKPAVTGKLETDFLRPVPVGATLHIAARIDGVAGRKIYNSAVGHLDDENGPVAARARALYVVVGVEHFVKHSPEDSSVFYERAKDYDYEVNP